MASNSHFPSPASQNEWKRTLYERALRSARCTGGPSRDVDDPPPAGSNSSGDRQASEQLVRSCGTGAYKCAIDTTYELRVATRHRVHVCYGTYVLCAATRVHCIVSCGATGSIPPPDPRARSRSSASSRSRARLAYSSLSHVRRAVASTCTCTSPHNSTAVINSSAAWGKSPGQYTKTTRRRGPDARKMLVLQPLTSDLLWDSLESAMVQGEGAGHPRDACTRPHPERFSRLRRPHNISSGGGPWQ